MSNFPFLKEPISPLFLQDVVFMDALRRIAVVEKMAETDLFVKHMTECVSLYERIRMMRPNKFSLFLNGTSRDIDSALEVARVLIIVLVFVFVGIAIQTFLCVSGLLWYWTLPITYAAFGAGCYAFHTTNVVRKNKSRVLKWTTCILDAMYDESERVKQGTVVMFPETQSVYMGSVDDGII